MDIEAVEKERIETFTIKCDGCGANMEFDPETQNLKCFHCGLTKEFEKSNLVSESDIHEALTDENKWADVINAYKCENCGAEVVMAVGLTANKCPYCETPHVIKKEDFVGLRPNAVYPFTFTQDTALSYAKKYVKSKFFAPSKFKKNLNHEKVNGVYQPGFTFDSKTVSHYQGRIGKRHTRTVGSGKNRRTETYIVWRYISGTHNDAFDDVFVNADSEYSQSTLDKILPFNYDTIKVYDDEFLSGFMAKRYDRNANDCWKDAKSMMDGAIKRSILSKYSYDVVDYLKVATSHSEVTYKYVLLPIYLINYKYGKKNYTLHINGNSGKVTGKTPVSPLKVIAVIVASLLIAGGIALLFNYLN